MMLEQVEGRLAFMKAELKITDAQTTAWNAALPMRCAPPPSNTTSA